MATVFSRATWRARKTAPIAPLPMRFSTTYLPAIVRPARRSWSAFFIPAHRQCSRVARLKRRIPVPPGPTGPIPALLGGFHQGLGDRIGPGGEERLVDGGAGVVELELEAVEVLVEPLPEDLLDRGVGILGREPPEKALGFGHVHVGARLRDGVERPLRLLEAVADRAREEPVEDEK